ncbi:Ger(x)C family spore germination protein [Paenibacillus alginolyticus]|uniref:Ger(X)C family spore germination protein n=1 Tax=Paenibacillus alginolyticus TaxID=59839 RepID=A0ABT4GNG1_9BACL|nr:Ger(x)C family spore germination protein [Paenibacillus alginolyticus]MCY9697533.1 Ger(x)C family spore germination protein [Paenibacillus alginolyticus]MEC0141999.1 Ger(x)C family spore germination protein [Paenibacillus alginolyticus]
MKKIRPVLLGILSISLLTGCWDQTLLKNVRLILGIGFDKAEGENVLTTFVLPDVSDKKRNAPEIISVTGETAREARGNLGKKLTLVPDGAKNRFIMIGEQLAKVDIYAVLDVFYRDPKSALNAKIGVVEGRAESLLQTSYMRKPNFILNLDKQIVSAESFTIVPEENVQSICTVLFDPGQDVILPYLAVGEGTPLIKGVALFNSKAFAGTLDTKESKLCLLMADRMGKKASLTLPIPNKTKKIGSKMTFRVFHAKRRLDLEVNNGNLLVTLDLLLKVEAEEYTPDHLDEDGQASKLNDYLSKELTKEAQKIVQKLQKANCDVFGIGRRIMAFHPNYWKTMDWKSTYPTITIQPNIKVEISRPGIIF